MEREWEITKVEATSELLKEAAGQRMGAFCCDGHASHPSRSGLAKKATMCRHKLVEEAGFTTRRCYVNNWGIGRWYRRDGKPRSFPTPFSYTSFCPRLAVQ
mgnify:CR=1 FL=1